MPQMVLTDSIGVVYFVAQNEEGDFLELFKAKELIECVFRFLQAFLIFRVYEVDYAVDFGKVL